MMNKKETSMWSVWKYALLVPMVGALLFFNGTLKMQAAPTEVTVMEETDDTDPVFSRVQEPPRFPGGEKALMKFLSDNTVYPKEAQEKGIEGRVIVRYVVEKDGSVTDVSVVRGADPLLDAEAVRVVSSMPKWNPGKQNEKAVRVYYTLPVLFSLDKQSSGKIIISDSEHKALGIPDNVMYEVDGKVVSKEDAEKLNTDDIESIDVLKERNGEPAKIVITTKK